MNKKDLLTISTVASVVAIITYVIASDYFSKATLQSAKVKTFEVINPNLVKPEPAIFNKSALNPSVQVILPTNTNGQ